MFCKYLVSILERGRFQIFQSKHLLILKTFLKIMIGGNFLVCSVKKKQDLQTNFMLNIKKVRISYHWLENLSFH